MEHEIKRKWDKDDKDVEHEAKRRREEQEQEEKERKEKPKKELKKITEKAMMWASNYEREYFAKIYNKETDDLHQELMEWCEEHGKTFNEMTLKYFSESFRMFMDEQDIMDDSGEGAAQV